MKGDAANAALREVGIEVLVKQDKTGVESVSVAVNPGVSLVPIGYTLTLPQAAIFPKSS